MEAPSGQLVPDIIDLEASGFGRGSYPIEVGYALRDGRRWSSLIRPEAGWSHWDPGALAAHGISRAKLQRAGRSVREVCERLNGELRGRRLYSDAWSYDYAWLHRLYDAAEMEPTFRIDALWSLLDHAERLDWGAAMDQASAAIAGARHRASTDAAVIQAAYRRVKGLPGSAAPVVLSPLSAASDVPMITDTQLKDCGHGLAVWRKSQDQTQ
jgi:hypothetical protein